MKKLSFLLVLFFFSAISLKAECTYKDIKELNTLASYVYTDYVYNEDGTFSLTYYNLNDRMAINYKNKYNVNNGTVTINNLEGGSQVTSIVEIKYGDVCYGEKLRTIITNIPYLNQFYNRSECKDHMDLNVCSSRFLDYKLTESTFQSLITKSMEFKKEVKIEEITVQEGKTFLNKVLDIIKEYYIPVILVLISSALTYTIFSSIFRKIKHGI